LETAPSWKTATRVARAKSQERGEKLLAAAVRKQRAELTKYTNFLYLFIACIIVGSILGMDRQVLVQGFFKIFVPPAVGSIAAGIVGTLIGTLLGLGAFHTFFFVVIPIMAGGIGEGAIPLSVGYSEILSQPQGDTFAHVLPPVMLGSLTAILLSGTLNYVGKRYPHLTGEGRLQPGDGFFGAPCSVPKRQNRAHQSKN
jgi:malate:Na+ symporter